MEFTWGMSYLNESPADFFVSMIDENRNFRLSDLLRIEEKLIDDTWELRRKQQMLLFIREEFSHLDFVAEY